jgi:hypothetical protein
MLAIERCRRALVATLVCAPVNASDVALRRERQAY